MASEPAVARLDQADERRTARQPDPPSKSGHTLEGTQHGLPATGPLATLVDDVQRSPQVTPLGQRADRRPVVLGSPLQWSKP